MCKARKHSSKRLQFTSIHTVLKWRGDRIQMLDARKDQVSFGMKAVHQLKVDFQVCLVRITVLDDVIVPGLACFQATLDTFLEFGPPPKGVMPLCSSILVGK